MHKYLLSYSAVALRSNATELTEEEIAAALECRRSEAKPVVKQQAKGSGFGDTSVDSSASGEHEPTRKKGKP